MNEKKIRSKVELYNSPDLSYKRSQELQSRLQTLVDEFGEETVALAASLTISSLRQYLRASTPLISIKAVNQAEFVLR